MRRKYTKYNILFRPDKGIFQSPPEIGNPTLSSSFQLTVTFISFSAQGFATKGFCSMHRIALRNSARALAATTKVPHVVTYFLLTSSSKLHVIQSAAATIAARSYATAKPGAF